MHNPFDRPLILKADSGVMAERLLRAGHLHKQIRKREGMVRERPEDTLEESIAFTEAERFLKESRELRAGEFQLLLPSGDRSPSKDEVRNRCFSGEPLTPNCGEFFGRRYQELALTKEALDLAYVTDPDLRRRLLTIDQVASGPRIARVLDIEPFLKAKGAVLRTGEIFEIIDHLGYRPAVLKELLAFAGQCWRPGEQTECSVEEKEQLVYAHSVIALGSSCVAVNGLDLVPQLHGTIDSCEMRGYMIATRLGLKMYFLLIRKD